MKQRISDREFAKALLIAFANDGINFIVPNAFYDEDAEFQDALATKLGIQDLKWLRTKTFKVCRMLARLGVLSGDMQVNPDRQYLGEPGRWQRYRFSDPAYAFRLAPEKYPHYKAMGTPDQECEFLIRHMPKPRTTTTSRTATTKEK